MRIILGSLVILIAFSCLAQAQGFRSPFSSPESSATDRVARETRLLRESQERAARESSRNIAVGIAVAGIAVAGAVIYKKKSS
jgi:hypothetical protein